MLSGWEGNRGAGWKVMSPYRRADCQETGISYEHDAGKSSMGQPYGLLHECALDVTTGLIAYTVNVT